MIHRTAEAAEAEFYRAFADGDLAAMIHIWAKSDDVVCVHPGQGTLSGQASVAKSWREILGPGGSFDIVYRCVEKHQSGDLALHTGFEQLRMDDEQIATLTVTNGYRKTADGWRMVLHHAAPIHTTGVADGPVH